MGPSLDYVVELILEKGLVSKLAVSAAKESVRKKKGYGEDNDSLLNVLIKNGAITSQEIYRLLSDEYALNIIDLSEWETSAEDLRLINHRVAVKNCVFPLRLDRRTLKLAISDPLDVESLDSLSYFLNLSVEPQLAPRHNILEAIERHYKVFANEPDWESGIARSDDGKAEENRRVEIRSGRSYELINEETPIVQYVEWLIGDAIKKRASDIHLEPLEKRFRVRYRIDGELAEVENPPQYLQHSIISRLKIMADISIAEKRIPQDGRIQFKSGEKKINLRVSTIPSIYGESIVMRILDQEGLLRGLSELGLFSDDEEVLERFINLPDGLILLTGPTGSGKTTTLYSSLHTLNESDRKIITIEDPVEYQLRGINQVQVSDQVGLSFASALRSILRQAPDIIMIGEIRDLETAEIAINASLTGHMVFSTLHTADAPSAISRLMDIGIKPYLVSASLRGVLAQRLIRLNCENCNENYLPSDLELRTIGIKKEAILSGYLKKGSGCSHCHGSGYFGRSGIFEIFEVDENIQQLIYEHASLVDLRQKALACGMRTMRDDGLRKIEAGITTIEEVISATVVSDT